MPGRIFIYLSETRKWKEVYILWTNICIKTEVYLKGRKNNQSLYDVTNHIKLPLYYVYLCLKNVQFEYVKMRDDLDTSTSQTLIIQSHVLVV